MCGWCGSGRLWGQVVTDEVGFMVAGGAAGFCVGLIWEYPGVGNFVSCGGKSIEKK